MNKNILKLLQSKQQCPKQHLKEPKGFMQLHKWLIIIIL